LEISLKEDLILYPKCQGKGSLLSKVEKERKTPKKRSLRRPRVFVVAGKRVTNCWKKYEGRDQGAKQKKKDYVLCLEDLLVKGIGFGICQL